MSKLRTDPIRVACPWCKAKPGDPCLSGSIMGASMWRSPHQQRLQAAGAK